MVKVLFFARYREQLGCEEELYSLQGEQTASDLLGSLMARGEPWKTVLSDARVMVAINQQMVDLSSDIMDAEEVAFFPPVTGG